MVRNRFPAWWASTTIDSLESIPGLLERLQIRAQTTVLDPDPDVIRLLFLKEKAIFHKFENTFFDICGFSLGQDINVLIVKGG